MMDPAEFMMEPADFIDPGADDDERVKGIKQGHVRQWADLIDAIKQVETENWQLRQALGYPIPADKETPQNPFKCGICDARNRRPCPICGGVLSHNWNCTLMNR